MHFCIFSFFLPSCFDVFVSFVWKFDSMNLSRPHRRLYLVSITSSGPEHLTINRKKNIIKFSIWIMWKRHSYRFPRKENDEVAKEATKAKQNIETFFRLVFSSIDFALQLAFFLLNVSILVRVCSCKLFYLLFLVGIPSLFRISNWVNTITMSMVLVMSVEQ